MPEWVVPGHDRHYLVRLVSDDDTFRCTRGYRLIKQEGERVVGTPVEREGAFVDLAFGLNDGLTHLLGDEPGVARTVAAQHSGDAPVVWLDVLDLPLMYYAEVSYAVEGERQAVKAGRSGMLRKASPKSTWLPR